MSTNQNLTIIVLTYNSEHIIKSCLNHLNFDKYKVIVVDNASFDNTVEVVRQNFPQAKIMQLKKNIGYGNGNNQALKTVDTEFALILNPDSVIAEEDIEKVLAEMKKNPLVANAGPIVLRKYPFEQSELDEALKNAEEDLSTIQDLYWDKVGGNYLVRFIVGASLFMRMSIFKEIGFFDEKIFLYYEDDELCKRVRDKGYQSITVPTAKAFHIGGESSGEKSLKSLYKKTWHLYWSKFYWKQLQKGSFRARRSAAKFSVVYFIKAAFFALILNQEKAVFNLAASAGSFAFFMGRGSFSKDGGSAV